MTRDEYVRKVSTYLNRMYRADDPQEKLFFARELSSFVDRNSDYFHNGKRVPLVYDSRGFDAECDMIRKDDAVLIIRKPRLTAKDLVFLRDMKVSL